VLWHKTRDTLPQVASEQRRHKLSYHLQRSTPEADEALLQGLRDSLAAAGLAAKVIYSGGVDVDVLAQGAGGCAVALNAACVVTQQGA
jgi:hypothetical protein